MSDDAKTPETPAVSTPSKAEEKPNESLKPLETLSESTPAKTKAKETSNKDDENATPSSKSVPEKCLDSATKLKESQLNDLDQQIADLNEQGRDDFQFGDNSLVIAEHKTPIKSSRKGKKLSKKVKINLDEVKFNADMEDVIYENASKANLSAVNVKHILKHIVTNENVLAMVRNTMGESSNASVYEPKLTRSKTKELIEKNEKVPWPISPIKPITPAKPKLIEAEFKDNESSDEEYKPTEEDYIDSDDESMLSSQVSDFGSPRVPTSPICFSSPAPAGSKEDIETTDDTEPQLSESDLIASRTRSKLPLTETPLEIIESQFVAPDITTDMYDTECHDEEWKEFLQEFIKPIDADPNNDTVEEENDPEYNIMEDENKEDEWETRDDKAVKVSKIELSELMKDLLEDFADEFVEENVSVEASPVVAPVVTPVMEPVMTPVDVAPPPQQIIFQQPVAVVQNTASPIMQTVTVIAPLFSPASIELLKMQMDMHFQLLSQAFLLAAEHSETGYMENVEMLLNEFKTLSTAYGQQKSVISETSVSSAVALVQTVDKKTLYNTRAGGAISFPVKSLICSHPVFKYAEYLPLRPFSFNKVGKLKCMFTHAEDGLLAIGMEQLKDKKQVESLAFVQEHLMPTKTAQQLKTHVKNIKVSNNIPDRNPLKYYLKYNKLMPFNPQTLRASSGSYRKSDIYMQWCKKREDPHPRRYKQVTPKKMAVVPPNSAHPFSPIKASPLKQISPILKKYNKLKQSPKVSTLGKPILPNVTPELLLMAARRVKKTLKGVRRQLLPKLTDDSIQIESGSEQVAEASPTAPNAVPTTCKENLIDKFNEAISVPKISDEKVPKESSKVQTIEKIEEKLPTVIDSESQSDSEDVLEEDKEVDLNALMAASSRICPPKKGKYSTLKKTKQQKDVESSLALLDSCNDGYELNEEKASVFAQAYLNRVYEALRHDMNRYAKFVQLLHDFGTDHDCTTVQLFEKVKEILHDHEQLVDEFVGFLLPNEALQCGVFSEYMDIVKMREFLRKVEVHFSRNPQQVQKIAKVFTQFQNQPNFSSIELKNAVVPLLRGQSHLINEFVALMPDLKPPESAMMDFEEIDFTANDDAEPLENSDEDFEYIVAPEIQDKYGGKECPCKCHETVPNPRFQSRIKHCASCGSKFIDGRVYIKIGKALKPAKIIYHNKTDEVTKVVESKQKTVKPKENTKKKTETVDKSKSSDVCPKPVPPISKAAVIENNSSSDTNQAKDVDNSEAKSLKRKALSPTKPAKVVKIDSESLKVPSSDAQPETSSKDCTWTREDDRLLLLECKQHGAEPHVFNNVAAKVNKSLHQVKQRFEKLMEVFAAESTNEESSDDDVT